MTKTKVNGDKKISQVSSERLSCVVPLQENNHSQGDLMKRSHSYHTDVGYFPLSAHPEVFYSTRATAICQQFQVLIRLKMSGFLKSNSNYG